LARIDDKSALRRRYRLERNRFVESLRPDQKQLAFSNLPTPLAAMCRGGKVVAGYVAVGSEADPAKLLAKIENLGCTIALPYVTSLVAPMRLIRWKVGDPLEPGPFGLMQPRPESPELKPDIAIVPLLAFDSGLMRLGQGAGHYDRALSLLDDIFAVGLAWSVQEASSLPTDPWDIPLDAVLTEKSWTTR
jgi:5-formyltetrahydrofolate cyclo-ligase